MPHDRDGREVAAGDVVTLRCRVETVHATEAGCNVDLRVIDDSGSQSYVPFFCCNAALCRVAGNCESQDGTPGPAAEADRPEAAAG